MGALSGGPPSRSRPVALTVAGVDSVGGAGVAADLKTFEAHDVWGTVAVTAVTAQNTLGVHAVEAVTPELVRVQIGSVASDVGVDAAKTGMLATAGVVEAVVDAVRDFGVQPLVVDPVLASSTGSPLLAPEALELVRDRLLPQATVVTPNLAEAAALTGREVRDRGDVEDAARALADLGPGVVLVTGGHLADTEEAADCLVAPGQHPAWLVGHRVPTPNTHGGGCVLSAAVCAGLARGMEAADACVAAKHFVEHAIAAGLDLGEGDGPVDPGWERRAWG